ncbi:MAG: beta-N-acetylhexosaminidase [Capsulimonadales bacterium]|nr:beta-N-acetylhexosaminidase [Capsulimonadales bacterium]
MHALPDPDRLSPEEKVGQLLCFGWMAPDCVLSVNRQAVECIEEFRAGAMVVMARNLAHEPRPARLDPSAILAMSEELQSHAAIPLLLATDQEGGRVARFGAPPFTRMPAALTLGRHGSLAEAERAAHITGQELAAVGIRWNFAPVADIHSNPENPVIGDRSFGVTAEEVAERVAAQIAGYRHSGVLSCAKHFPGHGDTREDSHFDLPTLSLDPDLLMNRELLPFRAAIGAGVPTIMTAHIVFPRFDPENPATMSPAILTDLLRKRLGFEGLIVTDCLEMKAVTERWGTARAAVRAIRAGADMVMVCHTPQRQRETRDAVLAAVRAGEISEERLTEAVRHVLEAKRQAFAADRPSLDRIGAPEHIAFREALTGSPTTVSTTLGEAAPV